MKCGPGAAGVNSDWSRTVSLCGNHRRSVNELIEKCEKSQEIRLNFPSLL